MVGVVGAFSLTLAAAATLVQVTEASLPDVPSFAEYARSAPKVSRVLANDGSVIAEFFTERRTLTLPRSIPPLVEAAVLAAEDADFRRHEGISYWGIFRAMVANVWRGRVSQGGSTITQQVVKQVLLTPERTYRRKFREMLLARLLEQKLTKDEILAMYVSEVYLGSGRYGFEEAARFYFARPAAGLNLAQAAMLAGMMSAPEGNNPVRNPEGAVRRQRYVLQRMVEEGMVSEEEANAAADTRLRIWAREEPGIGAAPYFVDAVRREALRMFGRGRLLHDGLTVETTLDPEVAAAAHDAVADGLRRLWLLGRRRKSDEEAAGRGRGGIQDGTDEILDKLPPPPRAVRARITGCDPTREAVKVDVGGRPAILDPRSLARMGPFDWNWREICARRKGPPAELAVSDSGRRMKLDGVEFDVVNAEPGPQAAMVVLDPVNRAVLALVGGEDFETRPFNRAVQSRRPIGSTVKPFLYATALARGMSAKTEFTNSRIRLRGAGGRRWSPRNFGGGYDGREYGIAEALIRSINVIAVKVMRRIGPGPVADLLESLGFKAPVPRDLSLALGSAEASPLELANAFCLFAMGGIHDTPFLIERVLDHEGRTLIQHDTRPSRRLPKGIAASIRRMLRRVVTEGTARRAAKLPVPAWGKTGTTNRSREAWFVGSDGRMVAAILVGYDDRLPMRGATGGNTAVPLFISLVNGLNHSPTGQRKAIKNPD
ncbi:MAG: PBP1A family penicillin-binding protein [Deltaproteobacteria bacterium]|nr:PBP1A family penicillin-binding protein [Deltaproteobacteria bacterium]